MPHAAHRFHRAVAGGSGSSTSAGTRGKSPRQVFTSAKWAAHGECRFGEVLKSSQAKLAASNSRQSMGLHVRPAAAASRGQEFNDA